VHVRDYIEYNRTWIAHLLLDLAHGNRMTMEWTFMLMTVNVMDTIVKMCMDVGGTTAWVVNFDFW
jgi:hypothetical protein